MIGQKVVKILCEMKIGQRRNQETAHATSQCEDSDSIIKNVVNSYVR